MQLNGCFPCLIALTKGTPNFGDHPMPTLASMFWWAGLGSGALRLTGVIELGCLVFRVLQFRVRLSDVGYGSGVQGLNPI